MYRLRKIVKFPKRLDATHTPLEYNAYKEIKHLAPHVIKNVSNTIIQAKVRKWWYYVEHLWTRIFAKEAWNEGVLSKVAEGS